MNQQKTPKAPMRKLLPVSLVAVVLLALYALAGFLLVPWVAQRELPRLVEQQLHQRARIGAISFNPFTLRLHAREFALETTTGAPLFGFTDAVANLGWRSLLHRAWIFDEVRLTAPALNVDIAKDGRLNLAALAPNAGGEASGPLPRFAIGHFAVADGSIAFEDRRQGYSNHLEHLSIEVSSLSTLVAEPGSYALEGQTRQGAKLHWKGALSLTPLRASGTLALDNVALKQTMPYVDDYTAVRVLAGDADLELPYELALVQGKTRFSLKGAKLDVRGLALGGPGKRALQARFGAISVAGIDFDSVAQQAAVKAVRVGEPSLVTGKDGRPLAKIGVIALDGVEFGLGTRRGSVDALALASAGIGSAGGAGPSAAVQQLALNGISFDLGAQRASAKALGVADLRLALTRDAKGELDLLQLFAGGASGTAGSASAAKPAKWQLSLGTVKIGSAAARYADRTAKTPLALSADGLSGSFAFEAASGAQGVRVHLGEGNLALARFEAGAASGASARSRPAALRLTGLSLAGTRYDSAENSLAADAVRIGSLGVDTVLDKGRVSLLDLLPAMEASKSAKPLTAQVKAVELKDGVVSVADRASGIALVLQRLRAKLTDVSTDQAQPLAFNASADVKSGGHIVLQGRGVPARGTMTAKIRASGVALAPMQPLLAQLASVKLHSGKAALAGTLSVGGKQAKFAYSGSASVTDLALDDLAEVRLFGWKSLATDSLKASLSPDRIDIDELRLTAPAGRFAIAKDGTTNLSRAFARKHAASGKGAADAAKAAAAPASSPAAAKKAGKDSGFAVAVRRVRVDQGALDFSDDSLSPAFVAKIYELTGTANGLSSDRDTRSQFALEGRVDEFGYAHLSGSVNPFAPRDRSAFRVQLRNIDLATISPYSMRFAGYRIASGHMTLDLHYRVRDSLIEGDNKITLEKITLGDQVDSPDALKLPFELAIALLKDPDGTITLQVPVKGNLDDPEFSLAPLIWKAFGNLIGNIVAAPFRALANLLGGGSEEQGGAIAFNLGSSRLLPPEQEKIARIAAALAKRPELKLEIPAHYDSEADARALKRVALEREIGRRAGFAQADDEAPGRVNLEDEKTKAALRSLFAERFGKGELDKLRAEAEAKARAAKQPEPSIAEKVGNWASGEPQITDARAFYRTLLRRLREEQPLSPLALAALANQRGLAIEAALTAAGVDASRITRTAAQATADAEARQVTVQLSLAVR